MVVGQSKRITIVVVVVCATLLSLALLLGAMVVGHYGPAIRWWLAQPAFQSRQVLQPSAHESSRASIPPPDRAQAGAALRGNPGASFGPDAYPPDAIRAGEQGRTVARLGIDPSGTPVSCAIDVSSGSRSLDAATCAIALRRVQFRPARDDRGRPIASTYRLPVRWVLPPGI